MLHSGIAPYRWLRPAPPDNSTRDGMSAGEGPHNLLGEPMAIFDRLPPEQIRQEYTHYGRMFGLVPVYIGDPEGDCPRVCVRNWWPEWMLDIGEAIFGLCVVFKSALDPAYEPMFPIVLTGEIDI